MITTHDDDLLRSHDEVRDLLRDGLPGVDVRLERVHLPGSQRASESTRRYTLAVPRIGRDPIATGDLYSLPCRAGPILARARDLVTRAETCVLRESVHTIAP
jgi:hypothetical protein